MAKAGGNQAKAFAIVRGDHYILEGMFTFGISVIRMRRRHSNSAAVFFTLFSTLFCVRFSLEIHTPYCRACIQIVFCFVFSEDADISHASAIYYAGGLVIINAISIVANNQLSLIAYHYAMKMRVAVCSVIYKKVLRMSQTAMGDSSPGKIVNLLSNDVNRFDSMTKFGSALWCSPLLVLAIGYLLWLEVRWAGLIGMAIVFIIVPIQSKCARATSTK